MLNIILPPTKPTLCQYGLTENDFDIVKTTEENISKSNARNETIVSILVLVLAELTLFVCGILLCQYKSNDGISIIDCLLEGIFVCFIGTATMMPIGIVAGLYYCILALFFRKKSLPANMLEKKERISKYKSSLNSYNNALADYNKRYPGLSECGYSETDYVNTILNSTKKYLQSIEKKLQITNDISHWKSMGWEEFEHAVGSWFIHKGFSVQVTQKSGDGGYDVVVTKNNEKAYVQCKHYKNQIGVAVVRELYGVMCKDHIQKGYIAYLDGGLTTEAKAFIKDTGIIPLSLDLLASCNAKPEEQDKDSFMQIGKYWVKKEIYSSEEDAQKDIKSGKLDTFFSKVNFPIHRKTNIYPDMFSDSNDDSIEYEDAFYGIIRIPKYFSYYIVVYSTLPRLELFGGIRVINEKTKSEFKITTPVSKESPYNYKPKKKRYHKKYWY